MDNSFLHGTKEEMLGILFLLFAEAKESEEPIEDSPSSIGHIERKSTESESVRPITIASTPTASLSTKDSSMSTATTKMVTAKTAKAYLTGTCCRKVFKYGFVGVYIHTLRIYIHTYIHTYFFSMPSPNLCDHIYMLSVIQQRFQAV